MKSNKQMENTTAQNMSKTKDTEENMQKTTVTGTAHIDTAKLQLLADRIGQTIDAFNMVRLNVGMNPQFTAWPTVQSTMAGTVPTWNTSFGSNYVPGYAYGHMPATQFANTFGFGCNPSFNQGFGGMGFNTPFTSPNTWGYNYGFNTPFYTQGSNFGWSMPFYAQGCAPSINSSCTTPFCW